MQKVFNDCYSKEDIETIYLCLRNVSSITLLFKRGKEEAEIFLANIKNYWELSIMFDLKYLNKL